MMAIIGRLVCSAKLELVLASRVLREKLDGCAVESMRRLEGSRDVYSIVNVKPGCSLTSFLLMMLALVCGRRLRPNMLTTEDVALLTHSQRIRSFSAYFNEQRKNTSASALTR